MKGRGCSHQNRDACVGIHKGDRPLRRALTDCCWYPGSLKQKPLELEVGGDVGSVSQVLEGRQYLWELKHYDLNTHQKKSKEAWFNIMT